MTELLVRQAATAATSVAALLDADARELANLVDAARSQQPSIPTVVLVGETKRGKSSLVNALLGMPGLSPVDVDVATSAWLEFVHGPELAAEAVRADTGTAQPIDPKRLSDWATVAGAYALGEAPPAQIKVTCPAPILATGMRLIDTPGVGGLDPAHRRIALDALAEASALVMVVDAGAPLSAPELAFLKDAAERVELIFLALSKTDSYGTWRETLQDDRMLVARTVPRMAEAPWVPVSARLWEQAAALGVGRVADELKRESGVPGLGAALQVATTGRAAALDAVNLLRVSRGALDAYDKMLAAKATLADPSADDVDNSQRRRDSLRRAQREQMAIRKRVNDELRGVREGIAPKLDVQRHGLSDLWQRRLDGGRIATIEQVTAQLSLELADVTMRVCNQITLELQEIPKKVLADLLPEDVVMELADRLVANAQVESSLHADPAYKRKMEKRVMLFTGASSGMFIGRTVAGFLPAAIGSAVGTAGLAIPGLALGGLVSMLMFRMRAREMDRQVQLKWVLESIGKTLGQLHFSLMAAVREADEEVTGPLEEALTQLQDKADIELAAIDKAQHEDRAARAAKRREIEQRRGSVRALSAKLDALIGEIRRELLARGGPAPRPGAQRPGPPPGAVARPAGPPPVRPARPAGAPGA